VIGLYELLGNPTASSTTKTGRHEILLKVALSTKNQSINHKRTNSGLQDTTQKTKE
jgi:hypothetical protein